MKKWKEKLSSANMYQVMIHVIVLALTVEVFVLAKQNRELKSNGVVAKQADIKVGDLFSFGELIPVTTSNPVDSSVSQLVYLFTTTCPFCVQNIRSWEELKVVASNKRMHVVGICLDAPEKASGYAVQNKITYEVYVPKDYAKFRLWNRINSVPTTILRSRNGYAERVWLGILRGEQMKEIAEAISISHEYPPIAQRRQQ